MEEIKYICFVWEEDLKKPVIDIITKIIPINSGKIVTFPKNQEGYNNKWYARADYKKIYPEATIIDIM